MEVSAGDDAKGSWKPTTPIMVRLLAAAGTGLPTTINLLSSFPPTFLFKK
jgi:hypothetical protein